MSITFKLAASISVDLNNPSVTARSLVRALITHNQSLGDLMSMLISFFPELARLLDASEPSHTRKLLLAVAVLRRFYDPKALGPTYNPILIQHMALIIPVVVPLMINALNRSFDEPGTWHHPADVIVLSTLTTLLAHETGIAEFAHSQSSRLTCQIRSIIKMWIAVSNSTANNEMDAYLMKILQLLAKYTPTRAPLEFVLDDIPRSRFVKGLRRLQDTVNMLKDPAFSDLPDALATNMCGLGTICSARPALRRYLFKNRVLNVLCTLLGYVIVDRPQKIDPYEWPAKKYATYDHVLCISEELHLILKDENSSPKALLSALDARLLQSAFHTVAYFGAYRLTPCGAMPYLIRYLSNWCEKSRRVASRVLSHLNAFRALDVWNAMPVNSSQNLLAMSWHDFVVRFDGAVQVSPITGKVVTPCMNQMCTTTASESRRKRCERCKKFVVCSKKCFRAAHRAGLHKCNAKP